MTFVTKTAPDGSRSGQLAREAATARAVGQIPVTSTGPASPGEVAVLCVAAARPDLAAQLIRERLTLQGVRARLASESAPVPAPVPAPKPAEAVHATSAAPAAAPAGAAQPAPAAIDVRQIYGKHRAEMARRAATRP